MSTVRITCSSALQLFLTVIELSPPDPSGAINMVFCRLQEKSLKTKDTFLVLQSLFQVKLNVWLLRVFFFFFFFQQVSRKRPFHAVFRILPTPRQRWGHSSFYLITVILMETQDIQKGTKVSQKFVFLLEVNMFVICDFFKRFFFLKNS